MLLQAQYYNVGFGLGAPNFTLAADFNGDGKLDIMGIDTLGSTEVIRYSVPNATLPYAMTPPLPIPANTISTTGAYLWSRGGQPYRSPMQRGYLAAFDFYGNGLADVVSINGSTVTVYKTKLQ